MADDYGTCPNDFYEDERLLGAPLATITGAALLMLLADDHGRLDGNAAVIARRVGGTAEQVEDLLEELAERKWLERYDAVGRGGVTRRVVQVIDFHSYQGHPTRVSSPSKRGASAYPTRTGETVPSRRARQKAAPVERGQGVAEVGPERGRDVAEVGPGRGRDVAEVGPERGRDVAEVGPERGRGVASCARDIAREEQSIAEQSIDSRAPTRAREPEPAAPTDARAIGGPASAEPPPALEAREAQQETWGEDYAKPGPAPSPPPPPPRRLTRQEEAARMAELRAQFASIEGA